MPRHPAEENRIAEDRSVKGLDAYFLAFKSRAREHHCLGYGTSTIDAEAIRALRRRYSRAITPITYAPIFVKALALTMARNREANAILFRKPLGYRIVRFERIDVNIPITRRLGKETVTFIGAIRDAHRKSLAEIQEEIGSYREGPPEDSFAIRRMRQFAKLPLWLARLIHRRMVWDPRFYVDNVGTCGVSFVQSSAFDHFYPIAPTSVALGVGPIRREPVVEGDRIAARVRVRCTLMFDNYVVSGPLAIRLAEDFEQILATASILEPDERDRMNGFWKPPGPPE